MINPMMKEALADFVATTDHIRRYCENHADLLEPADPQLNTDIIDVVARSDYLAARVNYAPIHEVEALFNDLETRMHALRQKLATLLG
jgi:hypothetical protein